MSEISIYSGKSSTIFAVVLDRRGLSRALHAGQSPRMGGLCWTISGAKCPSHGIVMHEKLRITIGCGAHICSRDLT